MILQPSTDLILFGAPLRSQRAMKYPLNERKSLPAEKAAESSDAETGNAKVMNLSVPSVPEIVWAGLYLQGRPKRL